jgi:nucleotide-binding universal stress UspA family protein
MEHILIAYDGSAPADKAFDFALELAFKFHPELAVVSVVRPPEPPDEVETEAVIESAKEHYEKAFEALRRRSAAAGAQPSFAVVIGRPAEQIVQQAESQGIDISSWDIVARRSSDRWLLGSVSKQVIHYAHCTTTVVR